MGRCLTFLVGFFALAGLGHGADDIEKISSKPPADMQRADLYVWRGVKNPECVLVLTPGTNGNGEGLIRSPAWQQFAKDHRLALMGVSFASELPALHDNRGYYSAKQGSGDVLIHGIRKAFGKDLPIALFGFSAGAHFSSRFVEWKPERVITWCAYSACWWDDPQPSAITPPGIVACGEEDWRFGASLIYFKQGRAIGRPWLWIGMPKTGHSYPRSVEDFAREYFTVILKNRHLDSQKDGLWVDIDRLNQVQPGSEHPSVTGWLPDRKLYEAWKGLHLP